MTLLHARTNLEAHLYLDLHPCECGDARFDRLSSLVALPEGLASRYTGTCSGCGASREQVFLVPEEMLPPSSSGVRFGGSHPSTIIDAGEWMHVADVYSRGNATRRSVLTSAAAMDEVLKFVPPGHQAVPEEALWSDRGRRVYQREPGRFRVTRLTAIRETYLGLAAG